MAGARQLGQEPPKDRPQLPHQTPPSSRQEQVEEFRQSKEQASAASRQLF